MEGELIYTKLDPCGCRVEYYRFEVEPDRYTILDKIDMCAEHDASYLAEMVARMKVEYMDPVHQAEDKYWYFWTETWADRIGPYSSKQRANQSAKAYGEWLQEGICKTKAPAPVRGKVHIDENHHSKLTSDALRYVGEEIKIPLKPAAQLDISSEVC